MNTIMATRSRVPEVADMAETKSKANQDLFKHGYLLDRYLEDSSRPEIGQNLERIPQGQKTRTSELDSSMQAASISDGTVDTSAGFWRDDKMTYNMNEPTCFTYTQEEALDLYKNLFQSAKQLIRETFRIIDGRLELKTAALNELNQRHFERSTLSGGKVSPNHETDGVELNIVLMLMKKLWIACQDPISSSYPEDGAGNGSRVPQRGHKSSQKKAGNQGSSNPMSSQESSQRGQKRSRQPPRTPDSEDEDDEDEDEDPKKAGGGGFRGTRPRSPNEFGCPFFKHDPETHGGRGGCREYSHKSVGILLRVSGPGIGQTILQFVHGFWSLTDYSRITLGSSIFETMT